MLVGWLVCWLLGMGPPEAMKCVKRHAKRHEARAHVRLPSLDFVRYVYSNFSKSRVRQRSHFAHRSLQHVSTQTRV